MCKRTEFFKNLKKGDIIEVKFKRWGGVDYVPPIVNQYTVTNLKFQRSRGVDTPYIQGILFEFDDRLKETWLKTKHVTALSTDNIIIK
jgi:hypothetical protein